MAANHSYFEILSSSLQPLTMLDFSRIGLLLRLLKTWTGSSTSFKYEPHQTFLGALITQHIKSQNGPFQKVFFGSIISFSREKDALVYIYIYI
jgi:hypothetical protein